MSLFHPTGLTVIIGKKVIIFYSNFYLRKCLLNKISLSSLVIPVIFLTIPTISFADAESIFKENNRAVVVVKSYDFEGPLSQGSGFVVSSKDGLIVTNYHVISRAAGGVMVEWGGSAFTIEGLNIDIKHDLAILKIRKRENWMQNFFNEIRGLPPLPPEGLPSEVKIDYQQINIGQTVYVISSPAGFENTISEGIVSGRRRDMTFRGELLQITAPVSEGSSGGPVFNEDGEVIGVVTFLIKGAQNLNFAIPIDFLKGLLLLSKEELIPLEQFRQESEKEYIKWIASEMVATQDWSEFKIPEGKEIEVSNEVLKLNPYHVRAHVSLVIMYDEKGDKERASEHYKILERLDPQTAMALRFLGFPR